MIQTKTDQKKGIESLTTSFLPVEMRLLYIAHTWVIIDQAWGQMAGYWASSFSVFMDRDQLPAVADLWEAHTPLPAPPLLVCVK